jgi:EmrB/QacA subfamily drug resistance transporter
MNSNRKWLILIAIGIGTFMSALDGSVVNISLPVVSKYFQSDVSQVEWIVTIYLLVLSGLLLSFGRLGDMRGHRTIYNSGFLIFIGGSALCGLAPSVATLIAFRALQAIGAAMLFANSPAILTTSFPPEQRGQALGLQATMTYLGLTVGPSLGGWLTQTLGWRSVFYINVPVGLFALWLSFRVIPKDKPVDRSERFDLVGAVSFMAGLTTLLLALNRGSEWGWLSLPTLVFLAASVALLANFIRTENRNKAPLLDLSLFKQPVFSLSVISAVLNYICVYSILFLMPFYLIQGRMFSPAQAGQLLTAQPIVMAITAPISGYISDRIGVRLPATLGMAVLAMGVFLLSRLGPNSSFIQIVISLAIVGFGTGTFISPNTNALMGSAPRNRQGIASGVLATARNFGMVLGVGLAGAVFTTLVARGQVISATQTSENLALFYAIQTTFLITCILTLPGVLTTAFRGSPGATAKASLEETQ